MRGLGVKGRTTSWDAHERDQQFRENESIDIGKSQRLRKEGNARINKVSAMKPGLAKIIEKVRISWYFGRPEIDLHIAEDASCIDYTDTWSSKRVHWLSKGQSSHHCTTDYGCEDTVDLNAGVAGGRLPSTGIHTRMAPKSKIPWVPATFRNSRWVDHCGVYDGGIEDISISDPVDVKKAYSHIASRYRSVQWHDRSHGRHDASFSQEANSMEGRLVFRCEVSLTEAVQILCWSHSNDGHADHFCTYPQSFPEVPIVYSVGPGNGYWFWGRDIVYCPIPRGLCRVYWEWILCQTSKCAGH